MAKIIVFTRYPEPGAVKTRLIPALGPAAAADLHRRMTQHTLRIASRAVSMFLGIRDQSVEVRFTGGDVSRMVACFGDDCAYVSQGDGDLGQRMVRAFEQQFQRGERRVIIIGSDCPALTPALLRDAFRALGRRDLVLGPAADGGYYLIGLQRPADALFNHIDWGGSGVLSQTLEAAHCCGLSVHLLPRLADVDRPEDLPIWRRHNDRLSIIVPALNEEAQIGPTLERILTAGDVEVIVSDGGSTDRTAAIAESLGVRVITSRTGRAFQMNRAAADSEAGRLLFCHADTLLPHGYEHLVLDTLTNPQIALGAFSLHIAARQAAFRRIEFGANFRSRRLKLPYGDQALFLRREIFEQLGGFRDLPIMEDFDLARRAARLGQIVTLPALATTSPRRWLQDGVARTTLRHQRLIAAYYL